VSSFAGKKIDKISVKGFKSIRELKDFHFSDINTLIGANGAGKSNFIQLFKLLRNMVDENLQQYVKTNGGAPGFLFNGPKVTEKIVISLVFGDNEYEFELIPTVDESFIINEYGFFHGRQNYIKRAISESKLYEDKDKPGVLGPTGVPYYIYHSINEWVVYHFHDTGMHSPLKRSEIVNHYSRLDEDGKNIAPILLKMRREHQGIYEEIKRIVRHIAPFFDDFTLVPEKTSEGEKVRLQWKQRGSDYPFQVYHLSDGTLRFIALITALLQPNSPATIIIDEPELGLHPQAISLLAEVIKSISTQKQLIISTQSTNLVREFEPEDIITVNRIDGASVFKRMESMELAHWLEDYSIDELWQKNIIEGGPSNE